MKRVSSMQYLVCSLVIVLLSTVYCLLATSIFASSQTIKMTSWGFQPSVTQINTGDNITFENTDIASHWPASNIHPTHAIYPEFDPKKEVPAGQSWQFTFNKPGVWRFHDHLNPQINGQITVSASGQVVKVGSWWQDLLVNLSSIPRNISAGFDGLTFNLIPGLAQGKLAKFDVVNLQESDSAKLDLYLKYFGAKPILDKLLADSGGGGNIDCHRQSHFIGRESFKLFGAEVFKINDYSCHSGFIHGAMESFLQKHGTANLRDDVKGLCDALPTGFSRFECLHGVGHGVMAYQDYNLPEALKECQKLADSFSSSSCYGGIFMENVIAGEGKAAIIGHSTKWVSNDPLFPCNGIDQTADVQTQCYMMQTSRMLDLYNYNFDLVASQCLNAPIEYKTICFQSYGRDAAGQALRDPVKIVNYCAKVTSQFYNNCITGGVNVIIDFWGAQIGDKPYALCRLITNPEQKSSCYSIIGGRLTGVLGGKDQIINSCNFAETEYQAFCRNAAQV